MQNVYGLTGKIRLAAFGLVAVLLGACSGPSEDVRVTFCKDLASAMQPTGATIEWAEPTLAISRPSHAITQLTFTVQDARGKSTDAKADCWFVFEKREQLASAVANPIQEYATLPYAMHYGDRELPADELKQLVNAEQKRRGKALIDTLQQGAKDVAGQVRAGIGG